MSHSVFYQFPLLYIYWHQMSLQLCCLFTLFSSVFQMFPINFTKADFYLVSPTRTATLLLKSSPSGWQVYWFWTILGNELISNVNAFPWSKYVKSNTSITGAFLTPSGSLPSRLVSLLLFASKQTSKFASSYIQIVQPFEYQGKKSHCSRAKHCSFSFILFNSLWVCIAANKIVWFNEI